MADDKENISTETKRTVHAIKEGWIYKRGSKAFHSFRRRYMVLYSNKRIEYYESETLESLKGMINLKQLHRRFVQRSDKIPKKSAAIHGFKIMTEKRTWYCAVNDSTLRDEWIQNIRNMIDDKIQECVSKKSIDPPSKPKVLSLPPPPQKLAQSKPKPIPTESRKHKSTVTISRRSNIKKSKSIPIKKKTKKIRKMKEYGSTKGFLDAFEDESQYKTCPKAKGSSMIGWSDRDQESNDDLLPNDIYSSLNLNEDTCTESNEEPGETKRGKFGWNQGYIQESEGSILGNSLSNTMNTFDFGISDDVESEMILTDIWDTNSKYIELSDAALNAVHCVKRKSTEWISCFGTTVVKNGQYKEWKIKILQRQKTQTKHIAANVVIGIVDKNVKSGAFWISPSFGYAFSCRSGKTGCGHHRNVGYGRPCQVNDVVTMILNEKNELIFKRNDENYGVAFEVDRSVPHDYVLAVAFCNDQYDIQMCE